MDAYQSSIFLEIKNIDEERVKALNNIIFQKKITANGLNWFAKVKEDL